MIWKGRYEIQDKKKKRRRGGGSHSYAVMNPFHPFQTKGLA